jgi:hypothetical protein
MHRWAQLTIEVEIKEIKTMLGEVSMKLDALIQDRETLTMMIISERALKDFLASEPDLYSARDVKVAYR